MNTHCRNEGMGKTNLNTVTQFIRDHRLQRNIFDGHHRLRARGPGKVHPWRVHAARSRHRAIGTIPPHGFLPSPWLSGYSAQDTVRGGNNEKRGVL